MRLLPICCITFSLLGTLPAVANTFTLTSTDIAQGETMNKQQEFTGFGCSGANVSPQLSWLNPPAGTKSFAITVYDPDAPTGSGWWHWQVVNIPASINALASDAGNVEGKNLPMGSEMVGNDYGYKGFGGACPPQGHGVHHYQFTVHALSVEKLDLPQDASGALAGYMINANTIASSTLEALYKRD
ncbi:MULTISPECIES: YbhB/YbcL family Raf kinase inhibitor-like protein [unclassified Agarivorans]|uniref:YbhB/YbcL family Raf kinase inhibitor-like protein n=1 Tax=unclassified Agarivorans TaxID=2636026 RepID=UPI0026E3EFC0|nr:MULTISPECIES: YbhB/YbcL family Raf kinase inhibitor-like protein [unclassified Agarivorans]MDO6684935.1 YbhB/YbcL family Raf kinase inhibitor-like protein [Agarivorans sp. 3_MG-2023]MDO6714904.1 YbhB/YbcL family Raf kinase inhibitor-like protein [Agarivorans sp. 2_MG-2023]